MRYIIYGAGAIGGTIGARLHLDGQNVLLIARGAHLEAIQRDGLRYRNPDTDQRLKIPAVGHPGDIEFTSDDVVILAMKSQHTRDALLDLAAAAPPDTPVVCCQNGVANENLAARMFRHVYAMVVWLPATHLTPGDVVHHATQIGGFLDAGCYYHGTDPTIETVCGDLTSAGFSSNPDPNPMRWKYAKLLRNLGNALQAVCDAGADARDIMRLARNEALACYQAGGIDCASRDEMNARLDGMQRGEVPGVEHQGGSSWQSLQRGTGDVEADYLNGEICLLGKLHNVPTPANEVLRYLANKGAREKTPPGAYSVDEVMAQIEAISPA